MYTRIVDGNSVLDVYGAAMIAVNRARDGQGPSFLEFQTYRMRGHAGAGSDIHLGYRPAEEVGHWEAKCPVSTYRGQLLSEGLVTKDSLDEMEKEIEAEIDEAFRFARGSPLPAKEDLFLHLFSE